MDFVELINQKMFLGQEFLTWLWRMSERDGQIELPGGELLTIYLGELLVLGPAQGAEGNRVTVRGKEASLAEAREGLRRGKLVEAIRLGMELEGDEYWLTLKAQSLEVSSLKLPPVAPSEEPEGLAGRLMERAYLLDAALGAVDGLYQVFLTGRLEDQSGGALMADLKSWAASG